jgi:hypothetical protein
MLNKSRKHKNRWNLVNGIDTIEKIDKKFFDSKYEEKSFKARKSHRYLTLVEF